MPDSPLSATIFDRFCKLQAYVGWTEADAGRVRALAGVVEPGLPALVDDFYDAIRREPEASRVITGGEPQIEQLKLSLHRWLTELFAGEYDKEYANRRWRVGHRHVEIGLDEIFTAAAIARLRKGLSRELHRRWQDSPYELHQALVSLQMAIDIDLALIQDAYQTEFESRLKRSEQLEAMRNLVECSGSLVVILRQNHAVAYINASALSVTGQSLGDVLGEDYCALFLPEEERAGMAESIARVLAGHEEREYESRILCRDGSPRWVVWNAVRLDDFQGRPAVLATGQDISALKLA
jgi:PAS domain S-box-containing protein